MRFAVVKGRAFHARKLLPERNATTVRLCLTYARSLVVRIIPVSGQTTFPYAQPNGFIRTRRLLSTLFTAVLASQPVLAQSPTDSAVGYGGAAVSSGAAVPVPALVEAAFEARGVALHR